MAQSVSQLETLEPIDRTPETPGSDNQQGLLRQTAKSWLRCCIPKIQMCNISWNLISTYFFWIYTCWFVPTWFKIWSSGHVTCIAWFQIWPPGCVTRVAKLPWNVLLALSVSIGLVSSSARVTSVKSATRSLSLWVRDTRIHRLDQGHLGPIKR